MLRKSSSLTCMRLSSDRTYESNLIEARNKNTIGTVTCFKDILHVKAIRADNMDTPERESETQSLLEEAPRRATTAIPDQDHAFFHAQSLGTQGFQQLRPNIEKAHAI